MADYDSSAYANKGGYGKRPLWQWIVIYLVIAAILYGLVYYFLLAPRRSVSAPSDGTTPQTQTPLY